MNGLKIQILSNVRFEIGLEGFILDIAYLQAADINSTFHETYALKFDVVM